MVLSRDEHKARDRHQNDLACQPEQQASRPFQGVAEVGDRQTEAKRKHHHENCNGDSNIDDRTCRHAFIAPLRSYHGREGGSNELVSALTNRRAMVMKYASSSAVKPRARAWISAFA